MDRKIERPIPIYIYKTYQGLELKVFKLFDQYFVLRLLIIAGVYGVVEGFLMNRFGFKGNYINDDNIGIVFLLFLVVAFILGNVSSFDNFKFIFKGIGKAVLPWVIFFVVVNSKWGRDNIDGDFFAIGYISIFIGVLIYTKITTGYWNDFDDDDDSYLNV